jgi:hypothetical protein
MHCQQGGEVWAWNGLLDAFRRFSGGFQPFLGSGVHQSDRSECWPCSYVGHRSDRWWWPVWPVRAELMQLLCFLQVLFMHWFRGSLHVCRGSSLWIFELYFGGLCSFLEHSFVSDVLSRCPCLRGPRLVFFEWSCSLPLFGFRSLVGVSFCSFRFFFFFSLVTILTVNNCIKVCLWLASVQVSRRSQGILLPSSGEPKVSNPWNKCVTQNLIY